jgi:hypothetical protein
VSVCFSDSSQGADIKIHNDVGEAPCQTLPNDIYDLAERRPRLLPPYLEDAPWREDSQLLLCNRTFHRNSHAYAPHRASIPDPTAGVGQPAMPVGRQRRRLEQKDGLTVNPALAIPPPMLQNALSDVYKAIRFNSPQQIKLLLTMTLQSVPVHKLMEIRAVAMNSKTVVLDPKSRFQDPPFAAFDMVCSYLEEADLCVLSTACRDWLRLVTQQHCGYAALFSRMMIDPDWFCDLAKRNLSPLVICSTPARVCVPIGGAFYSLTAKINTLTTITKLELHASRADFPVDPFHILPRLDGLTRLTHLTFVRPRDVSSTMKPAPSSLAHLAHLRELHGAPMSVLQRLLPFCQELRAISCVSTPVNGTFPCSDNGQLQHLRSLHIAVNRASRFIMDGLHLLPKLERLQLQWDEPRRLIDGGQWRSVALPTAIRRMTNLTELELRDLLTLDLNCLHPLIHLQTLRLDDVGDLIIKLVPSTDPFLPDVKQLIRFESSSADPRASNERALICLPAVTCLDLHQCLFTDESWDFLLCFPSLRTFLSADCDYPRNADALAPIKSSLTSLTVDWPHHCVITYIGDLPALRRLDLSTVDYWESVYTIHLAANKKAMRALTHLVLPEYLLGRTYRSQPELFPRQLNVSFA